MEINMEQFTQRNYAITISTSYLNWMIKQRNYVVTNLNELLNWMISTLFWTRKLNS
jgi:hypothetical protein